MITGVVLPEDSLVAKRIELIKAAIPELARVAVLVARGASREQIAIAQRAAVRWPSSGGTRDGSAIWPPGH